jgi:predicted HicB family RNase H-like nuclease
LLQNGKPARGSDIIPLTASEARRWLEDHDHIKEIKRLFGEPTQAGHDTQPIDLRVSSDLKDRIESAALEKNVTINEWLTHLIERAFD